MPPSRRSLELDAGRIFRWAFLLAFLLLEWVVWIKFGHWLLRRPGHRLLIFTRQAAFWALILAGLATLGATLIVRLVLAPLVNRWRRPAFDPSSWMFHLSASEATAASVPARFWSGGRWRPGALVLTGQRVWFMPAAWDLEPWSMAREEVERIQAEPPAIARFLPVRHWPDLLHFSARTGDQASFAVADPDAVLAWFAPARTPGAALPLARIVPEGVFDA
jgi:hypothetical protein